MRLKSTWSGLLVLVLAAGVAGCRDQSLVDPAAPHPGQGEPRGTNLIPAAGQSWRAGIVVGSVAPAESAAAWGTIEESGVGWVRLTAYWNGIEPSPDRKLYLDGLKRDIRSARERGIQVQLVVHGTPWWAQGCHDPNDTSCHDPRNPPHNSLWNTWQWFMERLTDSLSTYPYDVKAYGIWNEPNDAAFLVPPAGRSAFDVYLDLLRYAEPYIRAKGAWVVAGELAQGGSYGGNWAQLLAVQHQYWDVLAIHQYNASTCTEHDVHRARSALNGMPKQIWLTEAGTPTNVSNATEQAYNLTGYLTEMTDGAQTGGCGWDVPEAQSYPDADWDVTFIWYMWPEPLWPHSALITDRVSYNRRPAFYCLKAFARGTVPPSYCQRVSDF
jgi:hypothetical protein